MNQSESEPQKLLEILEECRGKSSYRIMTPNEPPYETGTESRRRIRDRSKDTKLDLAELCLQRDDGRRVAANLAAIRVPLFDRIELNRDVPWKPSAEQEHARKAVRSASGAAALALAVYDPLKALGFSAGPWSKQGGIPGGALSFEYLSSAGQLQRQDVSISSVAAADYDRAMSRVAGEITSDVMERLRILCEADDPYDMFALAIGLLDDKAKPQTERLFEAVALITSLLTQRLKHAIRAPRPPIGKGVPATTVPDYTSFPGGHALGCAAIATVLAELTNAKRTSRDALDRLAHGIAARREVAGLHCTFDTDEGLRLGRQVGLWLALAAREPVAFPGWSALYVNAAEEWDLTRSGLAGGAKPGTGRSTPSRAKGARQRKEK